MFETAIEYEKLGFKVVPFSITIDTCKTPVYWKDDFKNADGWKNHFAKSNGIGVILGERSGNIAVIDVDVKHDSTATLSKRFLLGLKYYQNLDDIDFYIEETRSGGLHIWFRRPNITDAKFEPARTIENGKRVALIEVLGEGQLVFACPSQGYSVLAGSIEEVPDITEDQYIDLIMFCKTFNELPEENYEPDELKEVDANDQRVGSIYNRECDPFKFVSWLCSDYDWKVHKKDGDKYWLTRPGKDTGVSGTFNHDGNKLLIIFSSSVDEFESQRNGKQIGHTPFKVYTTYKYHGNYSKSTSALMKAGFVSKGDWPDIERIDRLRPKPINIDDLLPDSDFKEYLRQLAHWVQCPPDLVILPALSVVSIALCGMSKIHLGENWYEIPPIWSIGVAPPSERKSPVIAALTKPFKTWQRKKHESLAGLLKKRDRDRIRYEDAITTLTKQYNKALKDPTKKADEIYESILKYEERHEKVKDMILPPDLIQSDITPEALVLTMERNGDVVGIISAENEPLDIALGHYGDKANLSIYLKGYSGDSYKQARKHSETIYVDECKLAMSVLIQPDALQKLLSNKAAQERGMVARFLYIHPQSKLGTRELSPSAPDPKLEYNFNTFITNLLDSPHHKYPEVDENGDLRRCEVECGIVELDSDAKRLFMEFRAQNEKDIIEGGRLDDTMGWSGKLAGNIARIALALHWIQGGVGSVKCETMQLALNWVDTLIEHFFFVNGYHSDSPIDRRVLKAVKSLSGKELEGKTLRDVYTCLRTEKYQKLDDWEPVFDRMMVLGYMRVDNEKTKGRPKKIVTFNPALWKVYT